MGIAGDTLSQRAFAHRIDSLREATYKLVAKAQALERDLEIEGDRAEEFRVLTAKAGGTLFKLRQISRKRAGWVMELLRERGDLQAQLLEWERGEARLVDKLHAAREQARKRLAAVVGLLVLNTLAWTVAALT